MLKVEIGMSWDALQSIFYLESFPRIIPEKGIADLSHSFTFKQKLIGNRQIPCPGPLSCGVQYLDFYRIPIVFDGPFIGRFLLIGTQQID